MSKATRKQIDYIRDLAGEAGYTGDRGYAAAEDLLGDGRGWSSDETTASTLIEALKARLGKSSPPVARQVRAERRRDPFEDQPIIHDAGGGRTWIEY